jgi:hypothetical protein
MVLLIYLIDTTVGGGQVDGASTPHDYLLMFWDVSAIRRYSMRAYAMDATEE